MKIIDKRIIVLYLSLLFFALPQMVSGQARQSGSHSIHLEFSQPKGSVFAIQMFGTEDGDMKLDWGDEQENVRLSKNGTVIKGNTKSQKLTIYGNVATLECSRNKLTVVDVTKMPTLEEFVSRGNFPTTQDLSKNPNLRLVIIENSPLTSLDLSNNPKIDSALLGNNQLMKLTLPIPSVIRHLDLLGNTKLKSLDGLSNCPKLEYFQGVQTGITSYDFSNNRALRYVGVGLNRPISKFILPKDNIIDSLLLPAAGLKKLDLSSCRKLKSLFVDNNFFLGNLDLSALTELTMLSCVNNGVTKLDVRKNAKLQTLICNNNQIEELDLSNNPELTMVNCFVNNLKALDLSMCKKLDHLDCSVNAELKTLNLPRSITSLDCSNCDLSTLDVSRMTGMTVLSCADNKLTSLNIVALTELSGLNCSNNQISYLAVEEHTKIKNINVGGNPITRFILPEAKDVDFIVVKDTKLDACALNDLYTSLRALKPGEDKNGRGGIYLFNQVPGGSEVSNTEIVEQKGWRISQKGDASGCKYESDTRIITLEKAGTLGSKIPVSERSSVTSLAIIGPINGSDMRIIREMAGAGYDLMATNGQLRSLYLGDAKIVAGGEAYAKGMLDGKLQECFTEANKIGHHFLDNCAALQKLVLPQGLTSIGVGAFFKCTKLNHLNLPEGITEIQATAFGVCRSLTSIKIPKSVRAIGRYAFTYCASLKGIEIPEGVEAIRTCTFDNTEKLESIKLPSSLKTIERAAFTGATSLKTIDIPAGVENIEPLTFQYCYELGEVKLPKTMKTIKENAFSDCKKLKRINLPEGITEIGKDAFIRCVLLDEVRLPSTLTAVGENAFYQCESLKSLDLGKGVQKIGPTAFGRCISLPKIELPSNVHTLEYGAFIDCIKAETVTIPAELTSIATASFIGCERLCSIAVHKGNTMYKDIDGVLFTKDGARLLMYPNAKATSYAVPEGTKEIGTQSFWWCKGLNEILLPASIEVIAYGAFDHCVIKRFTCLPTTPPALPTEGSAFDNMDTMNCDLLVVKDAKEAYQADPVWNLFRVGIYTSINEVEVADLRIRALSHGWEISGLPINARRVQLYDLSGRICVSSAPINDGSVFVEAPIAGSYLLRVDTLSKLIKLTK